MNTNIGRPETLALPSLTLNRQEALGYVGYVDQEIDEHLQARFEALAHACERDIRPACVCGIFAVDETHTCWDATCGDPRVVLDGCRLTLPGCDITAHLRGACEVALMACTLGVASERELRKYAALSSVDALLYGAAASALVEAAANAAESTIVARAAARGLHTGFRFSPGYGDLPLSVQPAFLEALDATRRIGVTITEDNFLVPIKSVTAVVGLFEHAVPQEAVRPGCTVCQLRDRCPLRKKGLTCHG